MDQTLLEQARDYALSGGGSGIITRFGIAVMTWGGQSQLYDLKSTTKSIGITALGLALKDNLVEVNDLAQDHLTDIGIPPASNQSTGWLDGITVLHLATHTAGFDKPGGYIELLYEPGVFWSYSDGGANWLADLLTVTYGVDLNDILFSRVFDALGIKNTDLTWRDNLYRDDTINGIKRREFGSGISANVDAMARLGYLYLRRGLWDDQRIIPEQFVDHASQPETSIVGLPVADPVSYPGASSHYGLLWWNNGDGSLVNVPTDAYWSWGLYDSLIIVIPSLDIVVARAGDGLRSGWNGDYDVIAPFIEPIVESVGSLPNQGPLVNAGADQQIVLPMDTVSLDGTVSDDGLPDGTLVTSWSMASGPGTVNFADSTAVDTTASFTAAGEYTLELSADDGDIVTSDTVNITVKTESLLTTITVSPAAVSLPVNGTQQFSASGQDQYGDPIEVNPQWSATGGSIDSNGLYVGGAVAGNYQVTASDGSITGQAAVTISDTVIPTEAYLSFDGSDDVVGVADAPSLDLTTQITLEAWIRPTTISDSKAQDRVISKTTDYEMTISTGDTGCQFGTSGDVQWRATIGGQDQRICGGSLTPGNWHHLAGTYDGSLMVLYVDGVPLATAERSGAIATNDVDLTLGNRPDAARGFDGDLDEVCIWNRALSAAEINAWMNKELTGTESGLVAYYALDEGQGQTAFDGTNNSNHGVLGFSTNVENNDPVWVSTIPIPSSAISVTWPPNSATVAGHVTVYAAIDQGVTVDNVTLFVDGEVFAVLPGPLYETNLDTTAYSNGNHIVSVTAVDGTGQEHADEINIIVDNGGPSPMPYDTSMVIRGIVWTPASSIVRDASGSDSWVLTWANDDEQYASYGDGWGFSEEHSPGLKLSLGYAKISGPADAFVGTDISSPTGEQPDADGSAGKKPAGMLMVDGVLYQWVRNADNAGEQCQLTWSTDHAETWNWNTWLFTEFGFCTFLNFGQNYANARDSFVYVYTPDSPSAYYETDTLVLMRVLKGQITDRAAYEFFAGFDTFGNPMWSKDINARSSVFDFPGGVNRLSVSFNAGIGRYLMTMRSRGMNGGLNQFSVFEAPEPWGPWTTIYFTERWEGGVLDNNQGGWGDTQQIPGKWISNDGRNFYMVFAGDDSFAVRQAFLNIITDTVAPSISLESPNDGAQVTGTVTLSADAGDNTSVASVSFAIDGSVVGVVSAPPYQWDWGTTVADNGGHAIMATARDTSGNEASDTINVTVANNQGPLVNAGADQQIVLPMDTVSLDGTVSDDGLPDGTLVTIWSTVSGPGAVNFADSTAVDTTASFTAAGEYTLELSADDGDIVTSDTVNITVKTESSPIFLEGDLDEDKDIDGADLSEFISTFDPGISDLGAFAINFGRIY